MNTWRIIVPIFTPGRTVSPMQHISNFVENQQIVSKKTSPEANRKVGWVRTGRQGDRASAQFLATPNGEGAYQRVSIDGDWFKTANNRSRSASGQGSTKAWFRGRHHDGI
jgi:hypothetical protein